MKLDLVLAKVFQFVVSVMFVTMVMVYFGMLLMVPLAVMWYAVKFTSIFLPTILAVIIGIGVLGYLGLKVSKMTELLDVLLSIGIDFVEFGFKQKERFHPLIGDTQPNPS